MLEKFIPNFIKQQIKDKLGVPNMFASFKNMKKLGFNPTYIIDVGAYTGDWTAEMRKIFPDASFLMVEGQKEKELILAKLAKNIGRCAYKIALLGAEKKSVTFNKYETASSVLPEENITNALTEERTLTTLDEVVNSNFLKVSTLLKIDTQGYELEILKGAEHVLQNTNVVLLEVSMLNIYIGAPLVDEVIAFMKTREFYLYDICSLIRRPLDNALYQSDFIFVKQKTLNRNSTNWA